MKKLLIYSIIALVLVVIGLSYSLHKTTQEKARYVANQTALLADVEHYKTQSGLNAASVQKLTLTNAELKKNYDDVVKTAEDLKIKVKRLQSVTTSSTETKLEVKAPVHDTIVIRDGVIDKLSTFYWQDPWTDVRGIIEQDSVDLNIQTYDTIVQFVHKVPHKFWFIKWGCKAIKQDIVSKNPHTNIVFTKYIELK
ncbi:MAG: hypothetical protein K2N48_00195 [Muribaculaceae bacterium]|nr:hypothetical protein [Muribaculaceae bacterium]